MSLTISGVLPLAPTSSVGHEGNGVTPGPPMTWRGSAPMAASSKAVNCRVASIGWYLPPNTGNVVPSMNPNGGTSDGKIERQ